MDLWWHGPRSSSGGGSGYVGHVPGSSSRGRGSVWHVPGPVHEEEGIGGGMCPGPAREGELICGACARSSPRGGRGYVWLVPGPTHKGGGDLCGRCPGGGVDRRGLCPDPTQERWRRSEVAGAPVQVIREELIGVARAPVQLKKAEWIYVARGHEPSLA